MDLYIDNVSLKQYLKMLCSSVMTFTNTDHNYPSVITVTKCPYLLDIIEQAFPTIIKKKFTLNTLAALFDSANPLAFDFIKFNFIKLLPDHLIFVAGFQTKTIEQFTVVINKLLKVLKQ